MKRSRATSTIGSTASTSIRFECAGGDDIQVPTHLLGKGQGFS